MQEPTDEVVQNGLERGAYPNTLNTTVAGSPVNLTEHNARSNSKGQSSQTGGRDASHRDNFMDFFSSEVFQIVLHNPTTAHRFLRFCQSRACGENMEFLEKVDQYNRLLDEVTKTLSEIHASYTSVDASRQINIPYPVIKRIASDIKSTTQYTIPVMESIFHDAQVDVEKLLASDIYPRFVKHQVTTSATLALINDKSRYQGLGDCFCMTDPSVADNPILYASDGFVDVTGYDRKAIIPRNCRFLQGPLTDRSATKRLRTSIDSAEETVELILNYRKNGDPFWNLLYVAPLYNQEGKVIFFLGAQINCSTTIQSCTDILKILSLNDDDLPDRMSEGGKAPGRRSARGGRESSETMRSSFFKSFTRQKPQNRVKARDETGMEGELIERLGRMNFRSQVEAFYTAYSKYIILRFSSMNNMLTISHYSPGVIDMLCLNLPNGGMAPVYDKDIFKVLGEHSSSASMSKAYKQIVLENMSKGNAISIELGLQAAMEQKKVFVGRSSVRFEEKYISHWTPVKDEGGIGRFVVLTIAPK